MNALSLYELNSMVSETISDALPGQYWVEAELMEIREVKGHCFMELVQKDAFGSTPVARASAKCWHSSWVKVAAKFQRQAGTLPHSGMQLLLRVTIDFHPTYGYALIVSDIDPTFTLGDMARKRQEIIQQLKDEGVFDLQRELRLPLFCQKIAVISSPTAAGYGDFCNQLANNEYGFKFDVTLFPAIMQGEQVEESICSALDRIYEQYCKSPSEKGLEGLQKSPFKGDLEGLGLCVVIIRGGGAVADMSGFDALMLAENVANFPVPIITGIGHDRDECILDMVSHHKVKTPTAAAAFLIDRLADVLSRIEDAETTIVNAVNLRLERQSLLLDNLVGRIQNSCKLLKQRGEANLLRIQMQLENNVRQRLMKEQHRLELLEQRVTALDPKLLLQRGYSMTLKDGKIVKDASEVKSGDEVQVLLAKGKFNSIVK